VSTIFWLGQFTISFDPISHESPPFVVHPNPRQRCGGVGPIMNSGFFYIQSYLDRFKEKSSDVLSHELESVDSHPLQRCYTGFG